MKIARWFDWQFWLYLLWAVFINAANAWLFTPMVEDYAVYGVAGLFVLGAVWLTSIPRRQRKRWIAYTVFSLLIGTGLSTIVFRPWYQQVGEGGLMVVGLVVLTWAFARVKVSHLAGGVVAMVIATAILPVTEWPFLTHFSVSHFGRVRLNPNDLPALPFTVVPTADGGHALITIRNIRETKLRVEQAATQATDTPDALANVLWSYQHRYTYVELRQQQGHILEQLAPVSDLAAVDPATLLSSAFPFMQAHWMVESTGEVLQYMAPTEPARTMTMIGLDPANYPANMLQLAGETESQQRAGWNKMLQSVGVTPVLPSLRIHQGHLSGTYAGHSVNVAVSDTVIIGAGSFTGANESELLLLGPDRLDVVRLDGTARVVASYVANGQTAMPDDVVIGPLDNSGHDAIFVNASPSFILTVDAAGQFHKVYTAPNESFRFEASIRFSHDANPEIITDDPSYLRDSPTRYFSSYTYRGGALVRNWRVYHTNVVNVTPIQFSRGGNMYVVASIYGSGKYLVLKRHYYPVVPAASVVLGLSVAIGWGLRLRGRRSRRDA